MTPPRPKQTCETCLRMFTSSANRSSKCHECFRLQGAFYGDLELIYFNISQCSDALRTAKLIELYESRLGSPDAIERYRLTERRIKAFHEKFVEVTRQDPQPHKTDSDGYPVYRRTHSGYRCPNGHLCVEKTCKFCEDRIRKEHA